MSQRVLKISFILLLLGLWVPALINHLPFIKRIEFYGVEEPTVPKQTSWWDGSAQKHLEETQLKNSTLRLYMIRIRNQYTYSLFNKISAYQTYKFKDQYFRLYSINYNEDYSFIGKAEIDKKVGKMAELQAILGDETPIITLIAPSKNHYYREYLPKKNQYYSKKTNYLYLLESMEKNKLKLIDFNDYFLKNKSTTPAIFANGGIHWTHYASSLAMDSLVNYLTDLKKVKYNQFESVFTDTIGFNVDDLDLALGRNLIVKPYDKNIRNIHVKSKNNGKKIKAVIIGDSFFLAINNSGVRNVIFTRDSYYHYYFKTTYDRNYEKIQFDLDKIAEQIKDADCIIYLSDIVNLENYGFGFPDEIIKRLK